MTDRRPAQQCQTMGELRQAIDALDAELMDLLALRCTYIDRAIELKQIEKMPARVPDRVAEVLSNARQAANDRGFDPQLAETIWHEIVEWSIERESRVIGD
ncbi:chorismate mutase [Notoacmeibacter sp. MSK16QG-6]|uniref:chorismate mutase n=1 Tax=Notoacmeibacter sp. MSK16QG-6 TaxID=2957982 RepID=UPI0020A1AB8A|nr:chorismate mutase [Notoacmeibacter sp. MSK16QG-6]MCP1198515.1 chorismate mutase [Notoacmeibacter sp. MSK16QG-6]